MTFNSFNQEGDLYFISASVCGWKRLFEHQEYARSILDSLSWLRNQQRMRLYVFVLMPSHLHAVVKPININISSLLQQFGSFTAHTILKLVQDQQDSVLLEFFHSSRRDAGRNISICQDIQAKNVFSLDFLQQKIEYIHSNPINNDRPLVKDRADYCYSSACFYDRGEMPIIEIDDLRDLLAGDG